MDVSGSVKAIVAGGSTEHQIDCGSATCVAGSIYVAFAFTFTTIPKVVATFSDAYTTSWQFTIQIPNSGITTSGFTAYLMYFGGGAATFYTNSANKFSWIAIS